jgi:hypothetical protein
MCHNLFMFVKFLYASLKREVEGTEKDRVQWYNRGKAIADAIVHSMDALRCPETEALRIAFLEELDKHTEADQETLLQHVAFRTVDDVRFVQSHVSSRIRAQHQQWSGLRAVFVAMCVTI